MRKRHASRGVAALTALLLHIAPGQAADVTVLTTGAFKPLLLRLSPGYEASAHVTLNISNDTAGGVAARVSDGESIDLVILTVPALSMLASQRKIVAETVTPVARSGIGAVLRKGSPAPDISTTEAFKKTILSVPSLAYIDPAAGGSSGIYLQNLFEQLGLADVVRHKAVLVRGGLVATHVKDGEADLGLQQISELQSVSDVTFVGPLPAEIQNYTVYAAGIPASARDPAAGRTLLEFLRSKAASQELAAAGLEPP